ncbi:glycosyltransferase family 4 protein [Patescibacteria group bacterium]|nr:glycosyltransferase family 4 protein [Patescibacteria group bacterium]MBU1472819.1 glycosyltransferase family 4 protein [Patescibacteria group bacterium]MBU2460373.1 glycosyltransferase family 4 protein [Patescibacteria group bacterium]MBU2544049.1 glycosyltransferase family 4 protein [Patescibacteria group bacterium]
MKKIAIVRGKFLNAYEMQSFEPLVSRYDITAFGSLTCYHDRYRFPVVKLPSPMDLPDFPFKLPLLNRLCIDAHYLHGLEERLRGFDLVHTAETYYRYTQQALHARKKGYVKKVIATVLENIPFNNEGFWGRKCFKACARNELDHIIALTCLTADALVREGTDPAKITVIGHGIDCKRFFPGTKRSGKGSTITILFSGRLEEYKGVLDVLHAARMLFADPLLFGYRMRFVFVGEGSLKKRMLVLEKAMGIEAFIYHKSLPYAQMPDVYRDADIFVAPSKPRFVRRFGVSHMTWQEQYCTALLEAQAAGLAIVTTKSGGIPENVGEAALFAKPGDVPDLAECIRRFVTSPTLRRQYGERARKRAESVHDIRVISGKILDVYDRILR